MIFGLVFVCNVPFVGVSDVSHIAVNGCIQSFMLPLSLLHTYIHACK